jgi:hypothetical protein
VFETELKDAAAALSNQVTGPGWQARRGLSNELVLIAKGIASVIGELQSAAAPVSDPCLMCDGTGTVLQPITPDELALIFPGGTGERAPSAYLIRVSGAPARVTLCPCIRRGLNAHNG